MMSMLAEAACVGREALFNVEMDCNGLDMLVVCCMEVIKPLVKIILVINPLVIVYLVINSCYLWL